MEGGAAESAAKNHLVRTPISVTPLKSFLDLLT